VRLHFNLSPNEQLVPFDYQHFLTGVFHKWLGHNRLHDQISLYSLGWLDGARVKNNYLDFPDGARWFVSFFEDHLFEQLVDGILANPEVFCGMRVLEIRQQTTPDFGTHYRFKVGSPVWVKGKQNDDGKVPYYFYDDAAADEILTATLRRKIDVAGLAAKHKQVKVRFDRDFPRPRIKKVRIKNTDVKASVCPIIIEGTREALQFAWNVGVGNGTGSGFGSLR
jgi:CRISPR-associated endoribonuclease Cas6